MSAQQHSPLVTIRPIELKDVIAFSLAYRMLKEYAKVLVTLNEHSAHVREKISTMDEEEQHSTNLSREAALQQAE